MSLVHYIPLSVRVRSWNNSLLTQDEILNFLNEDTSIIMSKITNKEKHFNLDISSSPKFIRSTHNALLEYFHIAYTISSGLSKSFIKELLHEFEIINLKNIANMLISEKFQDIFYPYVYTEKLSIKKLSEIRTFNEFITLLESTPYHIFIPILEQVRQEKNTLYWELALDNYFASTINSISRRMDPDSKKAIKKLFLYPLLHERIISLYRYRFHYFVEPSESVKYVPNLSSLISFEEWNTLAFSSSVNEFYLHLQDMNFISENIENNAFELKMAFQRELEKKCKQLMHRDLTSIASFLAFIQLKKIQYKKITTVLESKILNVNQVNIMQFL